MVFDWLTATGFAAVVWIVGVLLFLGGTKGCSKAPHGTTDSDHL
jgi:hypothetical protein